MNVRINLAAVIRRPLSDKWGNRNAANVLDFGLSQIKVNAEEFRSKEASTSHSLNEAKVGRLLKTNKKKTIQGSHLRNQSEIRNLSVWRS